MKILEEEEAEKAKQKLKEDMRLDTIDESKEFTSLDIKRVDNADSWRDVKSISLNLIGKSLEDRNIFIAHDKDTIHGKPQLIHQSLKKIT